MVNRRHDETDMLHGPLFKKILIFSLPIMAMNLLQLLFNAADMIVVGRFSGAEALAAVGAVGSLINLIVNLFMGLSVGTSVIVAQDYGSGDAREVSQSVHTSIGISVIGGFFVMVLGLAVCKPLLLMMGTPTDVVDLSELYMKIYFIGMPANMVYNFGAAILRAVGDSKHPMYYLIVTGFLNVLLNLLFVIVFDMNVAGVAWATVISQYLSVVLIGLCLMRSEGPIRLYPSRIFRISGKKLLSIIRIGLPAGLQNTLFSISNVLIQSAVNSFGSTMVAASSAASNVEGFVGTTMNAYYNAAVTFAGQNMGGKRYKRLKKIAGVCTILIFITWIVLSGALVLFGPELLSLYTTDPAVVELGMVRMRVMMVVYFTCGFMNVYPGLTRGMGWSILPMVCTLVGACLLRIVWLQTVFVWYRSEAVLFASYPVTWGISGAAQVVSFFWAHSRVKKRAIAEGTWEGSDD